MSLEEEMASLMAYVFNCTIDQAYMANRDSPFWDSLRHVELIHQVQEKFKVRITLKELKELNSLESFCRFLRK